MDALDLLIKFRAQEGNIFEVASRMEHQIGRVESGARRVGVALKEAFSFSGFKQSLMSIPGMQFLMNPYTLISAGIGAVTHLGMEAGKTAKAFEVLVGSEEKAGGMLKEITAFADATPYNKQELIEGAKQMLSFGVESEKVVDYLKQLGDLSAGDSQKFSSLALVFGQVSASGKLMGQDLLQFINAGFNPLKELQAMTGKTYQELQGLMSKGQITAENVAQAIAHATGEGGKFHGMMESLANEDSGKWSTLVGNFQGMLIELYDKIKPLIGALLDLGMKVLPFLSRILGFVVDVVSSVVRFIVNWRAELLAVGAVIGTIVVVTNAFTIALGALRAVEMVIIAVTQGWTAVQWLLNLALTANPIGIVVVAIGALITAVVYCWNKFAGFRAFILTMWDAMKGFGQIIKDYVTNRIMELLGGVGKIGEALKKLFTGDFSGAYDATKEAFTKFSGVESASKAISSSRELLSGVKGRGAPRGGRSAS